MGDLLKLRVDILIKRVLIYLSFFTLLVVLFGCNTTKYVPQDKYLLHKVSIKNMSKELTKEELTPYIRQNANSRIFGFWDFHLGLYNLSGEDQSHWWNRWLRDIGEEPVIFQEDYVTQSTKQLKQALVNKGYFQAQVVNFVSYNHNKRRVKVEYRAIPGPLYEILDVKYRIDDDSISQIVYKDTINSLLKPGSPFDSNLHNSERERITNSLRRKGYYAFSKEYIWFLSDSLYGNYQIGDSLMIKKQLLKGSDGSDSLALHKQYKINSITYNLNYEPQLDGENKSQKVDTLFTPNGRILYKDKLYVKPWVVLGSSQIEEGSLYDYMRVQRTQNKLSSLRTFNIVNINFKELNEVDTAGYKKLDCNISIARAKSQFFSVGVEGTNSSGNFGVAGKFKYLHKNLFRGAELFHFNVRLAAERQYTRSHESFNTLEAGAESGIEFPKFLVPIKFEKFRMMYNPKTMLNVSYDYQKRPDYYRTLSTASFSYNWRSSRFVRQNLTPLSLNYVRIPYVDPLFWAQIENTFLRYSYEDHLILDASYSYSYNQQLPGQRKNFWYFRGAVEEAGNILNQLSFATTQSSSGYKEMFGVRYAQYVKGEIDIHYTQFAGRINSFAYRVFGGMAYPYGNMDVLPFEKQYFSGGANGIRAWPVRGIGPGSTKPSSSTIFNQMGDIKLEANAEYRFKLFWVMEGAVFVDAGNIWTSKYREEVPLGYFKLDTFYKQIAIGTGAGLRLDFNYFLLRADLGIQARDPSREEGDRWVLGRHSINSDRYAFNFAIGYPF